MKTKTENRVLSILHDLQSVATTQQIAAKLGLSRTVTSSHLNQMHQKGMVRKIGKKPVYWKIHQIGHEIGADSQTTDKASKTGQDVFLSFIGAEGSQREVIKQCRAAITYPPNGLPILITGESGVGKSFLASLIYKYAKQKHLIASDAPFKILNCADYANNPELLSGMLFGYRKGSFTGAENDRLGLLNYADGGYLFLDEIHRLSFENQEKLFLFMDKGRFTKLGENEKWQHANVHLIFATTENSNHVLLETFRRRISVKVNLLPLSKRYSFERISLIQTFYRQEGERLKKRIKINGNVIQLLASGSVEGNIGGIRNMIQLSCANAYITNNQGEMLEITLNEMPAHLIRLADENLTINYEHMTDLIVGAADENEPAIEHTAGFQTLKDLFDEFDIKRKEMEESGNWTEFYIACQSLVKTIRSERNKSWVVSSLWNDFLLRKTGRAMATFFEKYGITKSQDLINELLELLSYFYSSSSRHSHRNDYARLMEILRVRYPKATYLLHLLSSSEPLLLEVKDEMFEILSIILIHNYVDEKINLMGLLIAHGNSTASSIQEVVNRMYGTFVFEAFDMPITSSVTEIIAKVRDFLRCFDQSDGLILIVDMGSLGRLYASIKNNVKGELLIINYLTTPVALDVGVKMINNVPFKEITDSAAKTYKIEAQYFESVEKNILISCMSGLGIAERIKEILASFIRPGTLRLITLEYKKVRELFSDEQEANISNTCLLITTNNLEQKNSHFPILNIYDALRENGERVLWEVISPFMDRQNFQKMMTQLIKLFSIEGVAARLKILNPDVVISESEQIIAGYESHFGIQLKGYKKFNIFMHLSMMFERLVLNGNDEEDHFPEIVDEKEKEFVNLSDTLLKRPEQRFNIIIHRSEIHLLYELFKEII
ncbi:sigma 54-interacting transcriptional regulator [Sporolactobacillus shoreicorticis]|uniref:Sigma 54-interacting transcriptional regulator n=1 Tax=Sporolactobacillus shoreicorticis TaxID=1923877 RepID=A0ABW5S1W9_9BACL|nr:sigma 54-interacting transcriptional regulator [Sporolactobacillus shoreicorticis]MCO7124676.1 sigma 54-interacting transcriptional regulator [Sporolactobacillus shoreicorticis]